MSLLDGRKRIVILGGGCGGVVAATRLGRKLGPDHDVILIDRRADHIFMPAFLFVMLGERQPRDISRSLSHLQKRNVKVIQSEIRGIDPTRQEVSLEKEKVSYDYLIVSLGLQTRPDLVPGFAEASIHPWEIVPFIDHYFGAEVGWILEQSFRRGVSSREVAVPLALDRMRRIQSAAGRQSIQKMFLSLGLELHRRGWIPSNLVSPLAMAYFKRRVGNPASLTFPICKE